jgi:HK97 family phage prohead protease
MEFNSKEFKEVIAYVVDEKDAIDEASHTIDFIVSTEIVDRDGEIVEAQSVMDGIIRKDEFIANPVCLISHQHKLPDGSVPSIGSWLTDTAKLAGKRVRMKLRFDTELPLGSQYWIAYKNKTMRAVSISFRIKNYRVEELNGKQVYIITELEMIEISVCAVGANKQALSQLKAAGLLPEGEKPKTLNAPMNYRILEYYKTIVDGKEVTVVTKMEPLSSATDISEMKTFIEDQFDRLKLLLLDKHNPDGCGGDDLGDPLIPSGEELKSEDILNVFEKSVKETFTE